MQVIRMNDYLGVRYDIKSQADDFEIYNVPADPEETNNLAAQMPALEQRMKDTVLQARRPNKSAPRPYDNELVPAVTTASMTSGVDWKAYEGDFPWVPDLEALKPLASGTAAHPDLARRPRDNNIGMLYSGYIMAPKDGEYVFQLKADAGALLRIHDATVIDADYGYSANSEASGSIKLQAGWHPFRIFYTHKIKGKPLLWLAWSGPGIDEQPIPDTAFGRATP
jgi:hypothetical protein